MTILMLMSDKFKFCNKYVAQMGQAVVQIMKLTRFDSNAQMCNI